MHSITKTETEKKTFFMQTDVIKFIKELGFPIFLACILLYNQYTLQNFLVSSIERKENSNAQFKLSLDENAKILQQIQASLSQITQRLENIERSKK